MVSMEIREEISSASSRPSDVNEKAYNLSYVWRREGKLQTVWCGCTRSQISRPPSQFLIKTLCYFRVLLDPPKAYRRRVEYNYYEVYEWRCLL